MLQKTHIEGFRSPKYAGEQNLNMLPANNVLARCGRNLKEIWELLLEIPDYIEKVLDSGHFLILC